MKEYLLEDFPSIDYVSDEITDNEIGYEEYFIYDGKKYHASVEHDGTYWEYGIKGRKIEITEIND